MALPGAKDVRGESQQCWDTCFRGLPTLPTCPPFPERASRNQLARYRSALPSPSPSNLMDPRHPRRR
ncbi:hypothetical protein NEUTE1DRAFT_42553 [Neurospora tetrasperma FGSC 2508]|uniref:Uncharacterized protein n=1 Tax=Neurospora tetrasperma (strain FGSC 2508 / ATCC MYA-4615 / P0657) TaxID=510951 RepID=F8ML85_NEUT8|nr:uncharacterized protein NEUTE1DRAFT_42553 [Neurospora tetrasperma FGSC 2508]EGO57560.1 hypothetical protein NEUTE1DRAFT_42553 [Neurospora tetrasperma FGSC 2508]EGZ72180.1 hypothetical protein NEUTE2DRAFT_65298 [Neurospora tetrasperma FGSC 2509]